MGSTVVLLLGNRRHALHRRAGPGDAAARPGARARGMSDADADDWRPTAPLATLRLRAQLLQRAREYFHATGALEVETR